MENKLFDFFLILKGQKDLAKDRIFHCTVKAI